MTAKVIRLKTHYPIPDKKKLKKLLDNAPTPIVESGKVWISGEYDLIKKCYKHKPIPEIK